MSQTPTANGGNLDPAQVKRFGAHSDWADPDGAWRALHDINPARTEFISRAASQCLPVGGLEGARLLDLGCGGGILSAALAKEGAQVTGVDAQEVAINAARQYAASQKLAIDFRHESADEHRAGSPYDVVVCCELLEHVPDFDRLIKDCAGLTRPGGINVYSTLTRTPLSFAGAILGAEYLLNIVPRGTHRYIDFIKPSELRSSASRHGLELIGLNGLAYNPWTRRARLSASIAINYLAAFRRR